MHYSLFQGVYTPLSDRLARVGGTILPFAAILVLALAVGTSTIYQAAGRHPTIPISSSQAASTSHHQTTTTPPSQTKNSGRQGPSAATAKNTSSPAGQTAGAPVLASGGTGGGEISPASSASGGGSTSSLPPSNNTAVTVPGQSVSVGDKTMLSTSPLTLTIN